MSEAMYYLVQCFGLVEAKSLPSKRSATAYPQGRWWSGYVVALHESSRSNYIPIIIKIRIHNGSSLHPLTDSAEQPAAKQSC